MTGEVMLQLGRALALVFRLGPNGGRAPRVLIGKDTRRSGYMLEDALAAGLCSMGVNVLQVGPDPDAGPRVPDRRHALRRGRDDHRLAQPVRGQRRQVLLARRLQAARRRRGADRGAHGLARARAPARARRGHRQRAPDRRRGGALHRLPEEDLPAPADARGAAHRDRLRERRGLQGGADRARGARRGRGRGRQPAQRHEHQRGLRRDPSGAPRGLRAQAPRGRRHRRRRRRGSRDPGRRARRDRRRRPDPGHVRARAAAARRAARATRWSAR